MNSNSPPEEAAQRALVFFIDRSLGKNAVPTALRNAGEKVILHDDLFAQAAKDEEWLGRAGREGWIVLSADKKIRYREGEREALKAAGVCAFILTTKGGVTGAQMGEAFVKALPRIKAHLLKQAPPLIAHVWKDGSVEGVFPKGA